MRRFALALAALLPAAALAQEAPDTGMADLVRAEDVADAEIYSIANAYDEAFWESGGDFGVITTDWDSIGEAESVILDRAGQVVGVTVDVGGFLGIGDKDVLLPLADIRLLPSPDDDDELIIVTRLSEEQLEEKDDLEGIFGDD